MDGTAPTGTAMRNDPSAPYSSNLTSALHSATGNIMRPDTGKGRHDSISMSGLTPQYTSGAMPISMGNAGRQQQRRESNAAGSLMAGMSWGGNSMNSWIQNDIVMQGTSPFSGGFRSPSYHSSSYLPKLEANFMRDFACCGITLPSLHDLLSHYEHEHSSMAMPNVQTTPKAQNVTPSTPAQASQPPHASANLAAIQTRPGSMLQHTGLDRSAHTTPGQSKTHYQASQEMEAVEDMEMDDIDDYNFDPSMGMANLNSGFPLANGHAFGQQSGFAQQQGRVPPLDLNNLGNPLQNFQGIRQSQPGTPISAGGRPYHGNPTVSSVNTPTLTAHPRQHQLRTPDSSAPGTPRELDSEFVGDVGSMSMETPGYMMPQTDMPAFGFGNDGNVAEVYINDPAKRLISPNAGLQDQQTVHQRLGNAQYGPDSDIARRIRERQQKVGLADTLNGEEPKPFRCPVIGCEKAYKNQNGLKYHKTHGHNNQQLHENADGTYSIVNPETLSPYPGTMGMEKEKPYKCDHCGKRYKNLNGLKYHKTHSPPCNPDLKGNMSMPINTNAVNANVAGAGLPHIGEEL